MFFLSVGFYILLSFDKNSWCDADCVKCKLFANWQKPGINVWWFAKIGHSIVHSISRPGVRVSTDCCQMSAVRSPLWSRGHVSPGYDVVFIFVIQFRQQLNNGHSFEYNIDFTVLSNHAAVPDYTRRTPNSSSGLQFEKNSVMNKIWNINYIINKLVTSRNMILT